MADWFVTQQRKLTATDLMIASAVAKVRDKHFGLWVEEELLGQSFLVSLVKALSP